MINLVKNEWIKLFKRISTYIMLALIVLGTLLFAFLTQWIMNLNSENEIPDWKEVLQADIAFYQEELKNNDSGWYGDWLEAELAISEYRLENNIPPTEFDYSMWTFIDESSGIVNFVGLFVIIIAAGIVAHEYSWGTIKMLLIKPYKRWKILLSKYITVILSLVLMLTLLFASAAAIGAIFFGLGDHSAIHLTYENGKVVEQSLLFHLMRIYLLTSASVILLATMAFMISAAFRASNLAIGLSVFLLLAGPTITGLLSQHFDWVKYTLFANTDLLQYISGGVLIEGMTMEFSLLMLAIHFVIFIAIAFAIFTKRDVSA